MMMMLPMARIVLFLCGTDHADDDNEDYKHPAFYDALVEPLFV